MCTAWADRLESRKPLQTFLAAPPSVRLALGSPWDVGSMLAEPGEAMLAEPGEAMLAGALLWLVVG